MDHTDALQPVFIGSQDSMGAGVAFLDYDSDGDEDLAVSHGPEGVKLYENGGPDAWEFTDVSADAGLPAEMPFAFALAAADLDRDGDVDLVVSDRFDGVRLFDNRGGVFEDVTAFALPRRVWYPSSVTVADVDGDGWTDVWAAGYTRWYDDFFHHCAKDQLFHARGDGTFDEVAQEWGIADEGCSLAGVFSDFDRDGDPDLAVANDFGQFVVPNRLFRNDGVAADGSVAFTDVAPGTGFDRRVYGMGIAVADVDGNGRPDFFTTSIGRSVLLLGGEDGVFTDATDASGVASAFGFEDWRATWGAAMLDVEANGLWDLAVQAGYLPAGAEVRVGPAQPSLLFTDLDGALRSEDQAPALGVADEDAGHGLAVGDFDEDGDDDLLAAALGGEVHLYRNDADPAPVLRLRLEGTVSNPDALGAQATLRCDGVERWRELSTGGSYASSHSTVMRMPLAGCPDGATLELRWPSGLSEEIAVSGESAAVERVEPEWLTVSPGWLPADGASEATIVVDRPPAGRAVAIASSAGAISGVVDRGDGTYEATLTAPAAPAEAVLTVGIDGETLAAHPRVRFFAGDRTQVRASTPHYVADVTDVAVGIVPRGADGSLDGPGLDVDVSVDGGRLVGDVLDLGDGRYEATVRGEDGPMEISARVGGALRGPSATVDEILPIDPAATFLRVEPGAISREALEDEALPGTVTILLSPRDSLGWPVADAREHVYEVRGASGAVLAPRSEGKHDSEYSLTFLAADVDAEQPLEVRVDGVLLDRRPDLLVYDDPSEVADALDPAESLIGVYHEAIHADGEDFVWAHARLEDAEGDALPWVDGFALASEALTVVGERLVRDSLSYKGRMRATGEPGEAAIDVLFEGEPVGVSTSVILLEPFEHDLDAIGVRTCLVDAWHEATGAGTVGVVVRGIDATGIAVGSNVPLAVYVDGVERSLDYSDPGAYATAVSIPATPGRTFVQTELRGTGRGSTTWVEWVERDEEPEDPFRPRCVLAEPGFVRIDPDADAGPDAAPDDAGADAAPDTGPVDDASADASPPRSFTPGGGGCACSGAGAGNAAPSLLAPIVLLLARRR